MVLYSRGKLAPIERISSGAVKRRLGKPRVIRQTRRLFVAVLLNLFESVFPLAKQLCRVLRCAGESLLGADHNHENTTSRPRIK